MCNFDSFLDNVLLFNRSAQARLTAAAAAADNDDDGKFASGLPDLYLQFCNEGRREISEKARTLAVSWQKMSWGPCNASTSPELLYVGYYTSLTVF